jgi:cAMP-dependent protein kinase regulator
MGTGRAASLPKFKKPGDSMFLIFEGEFRVYGKQSNGELLFLRILHPGDTFGEVALLTQGPRSASVEGVKQSLLLKCRPIHFKSSSLPNLPSQRNSFII